MVRSLDFASFMVGKANELAATAGRTFATAAAPAFNPLYLCGGCGIGKTHLMRAIEAEHARAWPSGRRLWAPADWLLAEHAAARRAGEAIDLRRLLSEAELLLVDDLHLLAQQPEAQELVEHAIGAGLALGGRVAIAADRPPHDLEGFGPRLVSLAGAGLVADLNAPDLELRMAILQDLAGAAPCPVLPADVLWLLASRFPPNIRILRGAFTRLVTYAFAARRPIDEGFVEEVLGGLLRANRPLLSIAEIQAEVSRYYRIRPEEMVSARRSREVARPRQVAMYLSKRLTPRSLPEIGRRFGGRDHTTVIHACRQIERLCSADAELGRDVRSLERTLGA
jgi:chromosomal replication initiator protein